MRYLSLFSGVEAASVAWAPLGWEPLAFCEVDEFPAAVLAHRFPRVPNLGDVCKVDWREFHEKHGTVDVLVGGSPCQSFSIAGNREGLSGESRLMFEYIRAVRDLVHASSGRSPRYVLWENVPGALSSEGGDAFGQLLAELDELGYGLAWRVLDAQYVRVPGGPRRGFTGPVAQRRRRVFLVGILGSPHAAEILFERASLRGDNPTGREARQAIASDPAEGVAGGCCAGFKYHAGKSAGDIGYEEGSSPTLDGTNGNAVAFTQNQRDEVRLEGGDGSLVGAIHTGSGKNDHFVMTQYGEVAGTLSARGDSSPCVDRGQNVVCMADDNANAAVDEDMSGTLKAGGMPPSAAYQNPVAVPDGAEYVVRRLTPTECNRLQGFPDGWDDLTGCDADAVADRVSAALGYAEGGKERERLRKTVGKWSEGTPDTPRYKAMGNSMAVPVIMWIGRRIGAFDVLHADEVGLERL